MTKKEEYLKEIAENPTMSDQEKLDISVTECKFDIIECCEEYAEAAGGGVDRICVFCSWGETMKDNFSCSYFRIGNDIKMDYQLCSDVKLNMNLQISIIRDMLDITRLCNKYDADVPKEMKLFYNPEERYLKTDYGWSYLLTEGRTERDIMAKWLKEAEEGMKGV